MTKKPTFSNRGQTLFSRTDAETLSHLTLYEEGTVTKLHGGVFLITKSSGTVVVLPTGMDVEEAKGLVTNNAVWVPLGNNVYRLVPEDE